jgi:hypothetical protein
MGLARPITLKLRNRVGDVGDAPVIEDVAVGRGQFGGSREILRGDERNRQPGCKAQESNDGIAASRANPSPQRGWRAIAAEFDGLIVWQGDRAGPEICDVGQGLAVERLADRAVAKKTADWLPRNGKARSATEAGAILVRRALQSRAGALSCLTDIFISGLAPWRPALTPCLSVRGQGLFVLRLQCLVGDDLISLSR